MNDANKIGAVGSPSTSFSAGAAGGSRELTASEQAEFEKRRRRARLVGLAIIIGLPLVLGGLIWGGYQDRELVRRKAYPNGQLHVESTYQQGVLNGPYKEFHANGKRKKVGQYRAGLREGAWETFNKKGQLTKMGHYVADVQYGPWTSYHPNGEVRFLVEYGRGGIRVGVGKTFYESGSKAVEQPYQNGMVHGTERSWFENGQLATTTTYVLGQPHGMSKTWHENGQLEAEGEYAYGDPVGTWKQFDESGKLISEYDHDGGGELVIVEAAAD